MSESEIVRSHHKPTLLEETRSPVVRFCHRAVFAIIMFILVAAPILAGRGQRLAEELFMIAVLAAAGFWAIRVLIVRETQVVFSPLGAPFLLVATYAFIRYALAGVEPVARPDMLRAVSGVLLFFLVLNDIRHRWQITTLVWTLTGLGVLMSGFALVQVFRGDRPTAFFARPADLAVYLLLVLAMVAGNFFFSRRTLPEKIGFAFAGLLACSAFASARAYWHWLGWLGALFVVALFVIQKRGWRFRWLLMGGCVLIAVSVIVLLINKGSPSTWSPAPSPALTAPVPAAVPNPPPLWKSVLSVSPRNLWLGAGPGMVEWLYPGQRTLQSRVRRSPNEYCNVFAETGLIGCALMAWIFVGFIVAVVQILNLRAGRSVVAPQSNRYAFAIAGLVALVAVLINTAVDLDLRNAGNSCTLLIIMGTALTCGVHRRMNEEEPAQQPGRYTVQRMQGPSRVVLAVGLGVLLLMLFSHLWHTFPAAWFLRKGDRAAAELNWDAAENSYRRAYRFDVRDFQPALALGDLFSARATWNARQREPLGLQAIAWYRRARTLNPYAYDVLIRIGRIYDSVGQRKDALENYRQAVQNDPKNASYHVQLGLHYQRWGDTELAAKSFHTARQLGAVETLPSLEPART